MEKKDAGINVSSMLAEKNDYNGITRNFVKQKGPDKQAAMKRHIATEDILEEWGVQINRTNTREMPLHLLRLYEEAFNTISKILDVELKIISGR